MNNETFKKCAATITDTVIRKNAAYGDSVNRAPQCLAILAPDGLQPHQYRDAALAVRLLDKISRALTMPPGSDEENPWADAAGYCLIRANEVRIEARRARYVRCSVPEATEAQIAEAAEILQWLVEHLGEGPELEELRSIGRFADFRRRNPPKPAPACACLNHVMSPPGECDLIEGHAGEHRWRTICGWQRAGNNENLICKLAPGHKQAHAFVEFGAVATTNPEPELEPAAPRLQIVPGEAGYYKILDTETGLCWGRSEFPHPEDLWTDNARRVTNYASEAHARERMQGLTPPGN